MKKIKQLISEFFWGIIGDILPVIIIPIVLGIIFVSFAIWYLSTKMIPWFFVIIYPITKKLLPILVGGIVAGIVYSLNIVFPDASLWILYIIPWVVYACIYESLNY